VKRDSSAARDRLIQADVIKRDKTIEYRNIGVSPKFGRADNAGRVQRASVWRDGKIARQTRF